MADTLEESGKNVGGIRRDGEAGGEGGEVLKHWGSPGLDGGEVNENFVRLVQVKASELLAGGIEEALGIEDLESGFLRAFEADSEGSGEAAGAGLDAVVEESEADQGLVGFGEGSDCLGHLLSPFR
jgi:hypothetical protein